MALAPTFNDSDNSWTVPRGGDLINSTINMLGGVDTLSFERLHRDQFTITQDGATGDILVQSIGGASAYYSYRLKNVETLKFNSGSIIVDLTTLFTPITNPTVTAFSPTDGSTNATLGGNIVVTFSETIQKGTGNIELRLGSATGTIIQTFDVATDPNITVSGSTLTINPTSDLAGSTHYFVTIAAGAVKDVDNNNFAGTSTYDFTTGPYGSAGDDILIGTTGSDNISGLSGNDIINGGAGIDALNGGEDSDVYIIGNATDHTAAEIADTGGSGTDEVRFTATTAGTLTLFAGDTGIEKVVIGTGTGASAVTSGTTALSVNAAAVLNGLTMIGNAGVNSLTGTAFSDTIDGGAGADKLIGGAGDDTYMVDLIASGTKVAMQDAVTEAAGAGTDTIVLRTAIPGATVTTALVLGANIENLDASDTGATKIDLTGNALNNTLTGNDAANILNGGVGSDALIGGLGNDTYVVDNVGDTVSEAADEGTDLVNVAIATAGGTYILGANIENATLTGKVVYNLTGNALDNALTGNAAINTLNGGEGNDTLSGGAGADVMNGGAGNDTYVVDNLADAVNESADEGNDTVNSSVTYTLGNNLENLTLTGKGVANGTGNSLDNIITGNDGANILSGGLGNDILNGGLGKDTLTGGDGTDSFVFSTTLNGSSNKDVITDFVAADDTIQLSHAIFTHFAPGAISADNFVVGTQALDANDFLVYNAGTLYYDADGSGTGVAVAFVTLTGTPTIDFHDFLII